MGNPEVAQIKNQPVQNPVHDEVLVAALRQGDFAAYGQLIRKYQDHLNRMTYVLTGDRQSAGELAILVMMTLWTDRQHITMKVPFRFFLRNLAFRVYERVAADQWSGGTEPLPPKIAAKNKSQPPSGLALSTSQRVKKF